MNFGYARVSAQDQNLDTQLELLRAAGVQEIFQEKISGTTTSRPQLDLLLAKLRAGDVLTVARLNRLGRSMVHLISLVQELRERDVRFVALDVGIDTETPAGRLVLNIFASLAEYDRESILERAQAGRELAQAQGKHMGRRAGRDPEKLEKVRKCLEAGMSNRATAAATGVGITSVKRYRQQLNPT
jgi:DNA invertase Pin-like site-specific DNA recombinase